LPVDDDGDGVYYLLVSDAAEEDFAGDVGLYALTVGSDGAIGPLELQADNAPDSKLPPMKSRPAATPPAAPAAPAAPAGFSTEGTPRPRTVRPAPGEPAEQASPKARPAAATDRRSEPKPARQGGTTPPADSGTAPGIAVDADSRDSGGPRPEAVFRTLPRASAKGRITGGALFDITFDLCASTSRDPEKELTFSYDFDGDGARDDSGHCRQTHRYQFDGSGPRCITSMACVGDGQQSHETCRTYAICRAREPSVRP
jgi:hypothetical protein